MSTLHTLLTEDVVKSYALEMGLPFTDLESTLNLVVKFQGKTQGEFAALVINLTAGQVSAENLTNCLKEQFPENKVGEKHGPHYLSLARTGKLAGVSHTPPSQRKSKVTTVDDVMEMVAKLSPEALADLKARLSA